MTPAPLKLLLTLAACACLCLPAQAAEASAESVERLLVVTKTRAMVDQMYGQMEAAMRAGMQQALAGQKLNEKQQAFADNAPAEFVAVMRQDLSWDKLRPVFVGVYRETFTQEEIDGLIAFYDSPAGRAFVDKMPRLMQRTNELMVALSVPMMDRMRAAMERAAAQARSGG